MEEPNKGLALPELRSALAEVEVQRVNALTERYGMSLSQAQARMLEDERQRALRHTGRVEMEGGVLYKLAYAFCDSPYIAAADWADTLSQLQALFYDFKNETRDALSDDELIAGMEAYFHGRAQGALEALEGVELSELYRLAVGREDEK